MNNMSHDISFCENIYLLRAATKFTDVTAACSILTIIGFVLSVLLFGLIITDRSIRYQLFYISVASFTLAHVLISGILNPVNIHYESTFTWHLGVEACKITLTSDVVLPGVACLILLAANVDRLLLVSVPATYSGALRTVPTIVFFLLPWIIAVAVIMPAWLSSEISKKASEDFIERCNVCAFRGKQETVNGTVIALFIFPSCVIVLVCICTLFRFNKKSHERLQRSTTISASSTNNASSKTPESRQDEIAREEARMNLIVIRHLTKPTLQALCVVDALFIAMWFPSQKAHISPDDFSFKVNQILVWIGPLNCVISSFVFLLLPAVRKNLPKIVCKQVAWTHRYSVSSPEQMLEERDMSTSNEHNTTFV